MYCRNCTNFWSSLDGCQFSTDPHGSTCKFFKKRVNMKKHITLVLEVETDDEYMIKDEFIKNDLEQEINCATNFYKFVSFNTEQIKE